MEPTPQPLTLRNVLDVFRRQRFGMIVILLIALGLGVSAILLTTPMYRSQTAILVDAPTPNTPIQNPNDPVNEVSLPNQPIDLVTQAEVLQSNQLLFDSFQSAGINIPAGLTPDQLAEVLPVVKIDPVQNTSIIQISVDTTSKEKSLLVATVIPQVYKRFLQTSRQAEVDKALAFRTERLAEENAALAKAEAKLEAFKKSRSLLPLEQEGLARSQTATQSSDQLALVMGATAAAMDRLKALVAEKASFEKTRHNTSTQANTALIESQKNLIADLISKRDALLRIYLPDRDEIKQYDSQIADAQARLKSIPPTADTSTDAKPAAYYDLENRISVARSELKATEAQELKIRAWANKSEEALKEYNTLSPKQDTLSRDVDQIKESIVAITRGLEDLRVRRNSARDPLTVLEPPTVAQQVKPKPSQYLSIAFLLGLFMAVGFALLKDGMDDKFSSSDEVPYLTGLPSLGDVRALPARAPALAVEKLNNRLLESYRVLRFNLGLGSEEPPRSILITSTSSREGKTDVAVNLATVSAAEDCRVILVDANLRKPSIHKKLDRRETPGLSDLLLGNATLAECLQPTSIPGLGVLTAGTMVENPAELLESPRMKELVDELTAASELVVFDAPPTLGLADARILATLTESVLYVAKPGKSKRTSVREGIEGLRQANGKVLGVTMVGGRTGQM